MTKPATEARVQYDHINFSINPLSYTYDLWIHGGRRIPYRINEIIEKTNKKLKDNVTELTTEARVQSDQINWTYNKPIINFLEYC